VRRVEGCPGCDQVAEWRPATDGWWWCCLHRLAFRVDDDRDREVRRLQHEAAEAMRRARGTEAAGLVVELGKRARVEETRERRPVESVSEAEVEDLQRALLAVLPGGRA
jgi:hypothetical protein